jgi:hypothetical protein
LVLLDLIARLTIALLDLHEMCLVRGGLPAHLTRARLDVVSAFVHGSDPFRRDIR